MKNVRKRKYFYTLPDHLAPYLINGDSSGFEQSELDAIDRFLKKERITIVSKNEVSFFTHSNDLNNLCCNCSTYVAHRVAYKRTLDKILNPIGVGPYYYTQMGRKDEGTAPTDGTKIFDCRVPMYGDYDKGGAYWGDGILRVKYTKDLSYIQFYRVSQ